MSEQSAEDVKDPVDPVEESSTSEETATAASQGDASPGESAAPNSEEESPAEKRIRRLVWEREQAKRDREQLEARIRELESSRSQQDTSGDDVGDPPLESDFDDVDAYKKAMREWVGKANEAQFQRYQSKTAAQRQAEERQTALSGYREKVAQYAAENPDFIEDVQQANVPINDAMQDALVSSEKPAELTHYLAKNPEHALKISQMSPVQAARELAKVEIKLSQSQAKVSNAPPPMQDVDDGAHVDAEPKPGDSVAEWMAKRAAQKGGKYAL